MRFAFCYLPFLFYTPTPKKHSITLLIIYQNIEAKIFQIKEEGFASAFPATEN
jgi:hypothetical protein